MGMRHLHMFIVDYMYVQGSLIIDTSSLWLRLPVGLQ